MLFNSSVFIFIFLPVCLVAYFVLASKASAKAALVWLVLASLFFYGWWEPIYLVLIISSILVNFALGYFLSIDDQKAKKVLLVLGICFNLGLITYFKYANFFVDNINWIFENNYHLEKIILPLAISFFTFQQIAFLVDAYRGETSEYSFLHYCLFVTFFPQLIAGPIVHHKEMLPQFARAETYRFAYDNLAIGLSIFILGLFKKVVLADGVAPFGDQVFDAAENGVVLTFFEAWGGALAYTLQLYFDFSGYSDMAIGLARMFGIILPLNFFSPYKATNIIEFWRRWHMTLSRFLRDYLYIALGGARKGKSRRYANLMITMLLGGLWHGAGWTFVIWGFLHGFYLIVNHAWRAIKIKMKLEKIDEKLAYILFSHMLTFLSVVFAWVLFRAESLAGARAVFSGMLGFNGISLPRWLSADLEKFNIIGVKFEGMFGNNLADWHLGIPYIVILLPLVWLLPNTQEYTRNYRPALNFQNNGAHSKFVWSPNFGNAVYLSFIAYLVITSLNKPSVFLYFNF